MPVIPSYVGMPVDGVGKKTDMVQLTNENADVVQREMVSIGDPITVANRARVDANGNLQVVVGAAVVTPTEAVVSVTSGVGGVSLFASNANAKYRYLENLTANPITIRLDGSAPVSAAGMTIGPYGSYEMSAQNGNLITGAIKGIAAGTTASVYVVEGA